jgi:[acyl-carrier-protein] S-malonyltransferase
MNNNINLAFVFPGQGSQSIGMLSNFLNEPVVMQTMQEANDVLNEDLLGLINNGPTEQLNLTTNTQPVMLASSIAIYRLWQQKTGIVPNIMAGHSLGEYSALVASGLLDFADALRLVRLRANAMQNAVEAGIGGMAAIIGLNSSIIQDICAKISSENNIVEVANYNSKEQTVISGHIAALEQACTELKAAGAKRALMLAVSGPFHCSLLKPASQVLEQALSEIEIHDSKMLSDLKIINNVNVDIYCKQTSIDAALIKQALINQVYKSVRWVETIQTIESLKASHIIECGCGKVLQGLVKRILPSDTSVVIGSTDTLDTLQNLESILKDIQV